MEGGERERRRKKKERKKDNKFIYAYNHLHSTVTQLGRTITGGPLNGIPK